MSRPILYLGMDVHKESVTIAVLPAEAASPTRVERLPNDFVKLRRWMDRLAETAAIRACYEASGAGYVLQRAMREWGYPCEVIAPSLIPTRPGSQRKHDKYDAAQLARLYRAGELTPVRIPSEAEERVRDIVRCRETFQREALESRHYILWPMLNSSSTRSLWPLTFCGYRRPESRAKHGEGVSAAFHRRPTTSPAAASGRRPRQR
jgi:hypothetical protein